VCIHTYIIYRAFLGRFLDITKRASEDFCVYFVNHIRDSNNMVCATRKDSFFVRKETSFCSPCIFMFVRHVGSQVWSCSRKKPSPRERKIAITKRFSATAMIKSTQFPNNRNGISMQRLACYGIVKIITALRERY